MVKQSKLLVVGVGSIISISLMAGCNSGGSSSHSSNNSPSYSPPAKRISAYTADDVRNINSSAELNHLLAHREFPTQYLSEHQVHQVNSENLNLQLSVTNQQATFPVQYLTEDQVQQIHPNNIGIWCNNRFPFQYLTANQIHALGYETIFPNRGGGLTTLGFEPPEILVPAMFRQNFSIELLSQEQLDQFFSIEDRIYRIRHTWNLEIAAALDRLTVNQIHILSHAPEAWRIGIPLRRFSELQKLQIFRSMRGWVDEVPRIVLDPEFPVHLLGGYNGNAHDVNEALRFLNQDQRSLVLARPNFPLVHMPYEIVRQLNNAELLPLVGRPEFPIQGLSQEQVQQLDNAALLPIIGRPGFPVQHLSQGQLQALNEDQVRALNVNQLARLLGRAEFPVRHLNRDQIQALNTGQVAQFYNTVQGFGYYYLSEAQVLNLNEQNLLHYITHQYPGALVPRAVARRVPSEQMDAVINWINATHLLPEQVRHLSQPTIHNISGFVWDPTADVSVMHNQRLAEVSQYFTQEQVQGLPPRLAQLLPYIAPLFPMNFLSEQQIQSLLDIQNSPYAVVSPGTHGRSQTDLGELRLLRNQIRALSLDQLEAVIQRPGFPVGFLTREQIQSLNREQVEHFLVHIDEATERERLLEQIPSFQLMENIHIRALPIAQLQGRGFALFYQLNEEKRFSERILLFSKTLFPFAYLSDGQMQWVSDRNRESIQNLRISLHLGNFLNQDLNHRWANDRVINTARYVNLDEIFQHFFDIATLPEVH